MRMVLATQADSALASLTSVQSWALMPSLKSIKLSLISLMLIAFHSIGLIMDSIKFCSGLVIPYFA